MSVADLQAMRRAGEYVATFDDVRPWDITKCSRASWYRFMASDDAPRGLCLRLGRKRLLCIPVFLQWVGASDDGPGGE